jgi:hypothetical protein
MTLTQGHWSRSLYTWWWRHRQIVCPGHNYYPSLWIWTIFHKIVSLDGKKCHVLDSRLLVRGQGHYAHNGLNIVWAKSFHWKHGLEYFTEFLHRTLESVMTLIQGHWSKVKVTIPIVFWHCPSHNFSLSLWFGIIFPRIVTLDQRKCYDLDPRSLVKGQGHYTHNG